MVVVRARVRDVVRVHRRERAAGDDEDDEAEEGERDVVAAQPPPGEEPRAVALDRAVLLGRELRGGVEREIGCGSCRHGFLEVWWGRSRAPTLEPLRYFMQMVLKSHW